MSVCWASRTSRILVAAGLAATLTTGGAEARIHVHGRMLDDSGHVVKHVRISDGGITIVRSADDSMSGHGIVIADSMSNGTLIVDNGAGMVRLFSDARVKAGDRVEGDVVAVFGSVHIAGEVTGSAVAVFGSIDFERGASVNGDAVAVGGSVSDTEGAHVGGQTVSIGFLPVTLGLPALPVLLCFIALGWLITLFFGWVFAAIFPDRLARVAVTSSRRTAASLALGVVSGPLVPVVAVLLMVTVIGIPIGFVLPFVFVAMVYAGQLAAIYVLGCKLLRRRLGEGGALAPVVAGSLLVAVFFVIGAVLWSVPGTVRTVAVFFHLVGALLLFGLSTIGTGAFLLSRFGTRPRDIGGAGVPDAAGPVGPVAEATPAG